MKKNRKHIIALLAVVALFVTGLTFAYWGSIQNTVVKEDGVIVIGTGREVELTAELLAETVTLVPEGREDYSNEGGAKSFQILKYTVKLQDSAYYATTSDLTVKVQFLDLLDDEENETLLTSERLHQLFVIEYLNYDSSEEYTENEEGIYEITPNEDFDVYVKVTFLDDMNEDDEHLLTEEEYIHIAGSTIKFKVTFSADYTENPENLEPC